MNQFISSVGIHKSRNYNTLKRAAVSLLFSVLVLINASYAQTPDLLYNVLSLDNFKEFNNQSKGWEIAGKVSYPFAKDGRVSIEKGSGILINDPMAKESVIETNFTHGDLDLEFDFMLSPGSSGAVFFHGLYGIELNDSWSRDVSLGKASGGILVHSKKTASRINSPRMNIARAPGLWQKLKISFQAPKFNAAGEKISNAKFMTVWYNGVMIYENIEVKTAGLSIEKPLENLQLTGNGGIAFKNIRYKLYGPDRVVIPRLAYKFYSGNLMERNKTKPTKEGNLNELTWEVAGNPPAFALTFDGDLHVPKSGNYIFDIETWYNSELTIDNKSVINRGERIGSVNLKEGLHHFSFNNAKDKPRGKPYLGLFVEGPGIQRHALHAESSIPVGQTIRPIIIEPLDRTIVQRCFFEINNSKVTFCAAVGAPSGIHYGIDLSRGAIVNSWKGGFIDATTMWTDRGEEQLARPRGSVIEYDAKPAFSILETENSVWPDSTETGNGFKFLGYTLNDAGQPTFRYDFKGTAIQDKIVPGGDNRYLTRTLKIDQTNQPGQLWFKFASAGKIELIGNGLYSIDDKTYYIQILPDQRIKPIIRTTKDGAELVVSPVTKDEIGLQYSIIW